jgi:hypothetical protein
MAGRILTNWSNGKITLTMLQAEEGQYPNQPYGDTPYSAVTNVGEKESHNGRRRREKG